MVLIYGNYVASAWNPKPFTPFSSYIFTLRFYRNKMISIVNVVLEVKKRLNMKIYRRAQFWLCLFVDKNYASCQVEIWDKFNCTLGEEPAQVLNDSKHQIYFLRIIFSKNVDAIQHIIFISIGSCMCSIDIDQCYYLA